MAPGSRILVRDAEWLVRRVDTTSTGGKAVHIVGISELVRDREAIFLEEIDQLKVIDPAETEIVVDSSPFYRASLLYMESLLRQTAPTDNDLYIGHRAAMDLVPYQLDPALQALDQPRQRILIADAVGLGKTLECGILLSELIRRGRGKRILVLAIKSMLTQFQKELWSRFAIALTRLDSVGIRRVRHKIPTNHNPFYYYDKAIISIDTLKQDAEYRTYLENAYWDIIVVDEAQNVAERGKSISMRSKLANLLASRSDTLIMLSATPHDGRARSFASLMNMLDPTAIADPDKYTPEDIKGLFIRRFKKDIQSQVAGAFKDRTISIARCSATPAEEKAFDALTRLRFARIDTRRSAGQMLFRTTIEKALFSSPEACAETIKNRLDRIKSDEAYKADVESLRDLERSVGSIGGEDFAKYQKLLEVIRDKKKGLGWTGRTPDDRLVIFTERIATMEMLAERLRKDLGLKAGQLATLSGDLPDVVQTKLVEDFGREGAAIRLLVASDVASEGINLHYLCHKMIHFDIPWSLMVFKQRNGRIDRYGQEREPRIVYLVTDSQNEKIRGDTRVLELLIEKDDQAVKNIGDPSTWMGVYDIDTEELITGEAIERGDTREAFEKDLEKRAFDPLAALMGDASQPTGEKAQERTRPVHSLFDDDYAYFKAAIGQIQETGRLQVEFDDQAKRVDLTATEDLEHRFAYLPLEVWPEKGGFVLSADKAAIQAEIRRCREDEQQEAAWPAVHYLWPLNPVVEWANDKVLAAFGRHEAPLVTLPKGTLDSRELVFILSGLIPNRKSHPLLHEWFGVVMKDGRFVRIEPFQEVRERTRLGRDRIPNPGDADEAAKSSRALLPEVVSRAKAWMTERRTAFEAVMNPKLNDQLKALEALKARQHHQLELRFADSGLPVAIVGDRKEAERRRIDRLFDEFMDWVQETMTTEDNPYIQVVAVLRGAR